MRLALALALAACGKPTEQATNQGSGSAAATLRVVTRLAADSTLVAGSRRVAIFSGDRWLESKAGALEPVPATAAELVRLRGGLGELELHLGLTAIAIGGEEHHERIVRIGAGEVVLADAHVEQVVATDAHEVWSYKDRLRSRLAVIDPAGQLTPLPELALIGKPIEGASPVSTKLCATPAIEDVAATRDTVVALVVECDPDAPVRLVTYRWPGPTATVELVGSRTALGFAPRQLAVNRGARAIAGPGHVLRLGAAQPTRFAGASITGLELADDGTPWLLADGALLRDGVTVPVARGTPTALARDAGLGIVVLATAPTGSWLLATASK